MTALERPIREADLAISSGPEKCQHPFASAADYLPSALTPLIRARNDLLELIAHALRLQLS